MSEEQLAFRFQTSIDVPESIREKTRRFLQRRLSQKGHYTSSGAKSIVESLEGISDQLLSLGSPISPEFFLNFLEIEEKRKKNGSNFPISKSPYLMYMLHEFGAIQGDMRIFVQKVHQNFYNLRACVSDSFAAAAFLLPEGYLRYLDRQDVFEELREQQSRDEGSALNWSAPYFPNLYTTLEGYDLIGEYFGQKYAPKLEKRCLEFMKKLEEELPHIFYGDRFESTASLFLASLSAPLGSGKLREYIEECAKPFSLEDENVLNSRSVRAVRRVSGPEGSCIGMEETLELMMFAQRDMEYREGSLIVVEGELIGLLKNSGEDSMLALRTVRNPLQSNRLYSLVAGATYGVNGEIISEAAKASRKAGSGKLGVVHLDNLAVHPIRFAYDTNHDKRSGLLRDIRNTIRGLQVH